MALGGWSLVNGRWTCPQGAGGHQPTPVEQIGPNTLADRLEVATSYRELLQLGWDAARVLRDEPDSTDDEIEFTLDGNPAMDLNACKLLYESSLPGLCAELMLSVPGPPHSQFVRVCRPGGWCATGQHKDEICAAWLAAMLRAKA
jgi:hypothetical protein